MQEFTTATRAKTWLSRLDGFGIYAVAAAWSASLQNRQGLLFWAAQAGLSRVMRFQLSLTFVGSNSSHLGTAQELQSILMFSKNTVSASSRRSKPSRYQAPYDLLRKACLEEFMRGFGSVLGGIIFSVMPPKKSWKTISNLSDGEKVRLLQPLKGTLLIVNRRYRVLRSWSRKSKSLRLLY